MPTITFDQATLSPPGVTNRSRSDGLDGGQTVTITVDVAGSVTFVDVPPDDVDSVSSLASTSETTWEFTPTAGVHGSWLVQLTPTDEDIDPVRRVFAVRTANRGLRIPAFNEKASLEATIANGSSFIESSDANEGDSYKGWFGSLYELYEVAENAATSGELSLVAESVEALSISLDGTNDALDIVASSLGTVVSDLSAVSSLLNAHKTRHQNGGPDEIDVGGLAGVLADAQKSNELLFTTGPAIPLGAVPTAGQLLQYNGTSFIGAPNSALVPSEIFTPPTVAHADDLEFGGVSTSLPGSGQVWNHVTSAYQAAAVGAPAFLVDPAVDTFTQAVGQRESWLSLSAGARSGGTTWSQYSALWPVNSAIGTNCHWRSRIKTNRGYTVGGEGRSHRAQLVIYKVSSGVNPDVSNGVIFGYRFVDAGSGWIIEWGTIGTANVVTLDSRDFQSDCELLIVKEGTTFHFILVSNGGGFNYHFGTSTYASTLGLYGVTFGHASGNLPRRTPIYVDYIRRQDNQFPVL